MVVPKVSQSRLGLFAMIRSKGLQFESTSDEGGMQRPSASALRIPFGRITFPNLCVFAALREISLLLCFCVFCAFSRLLRFPPSQLLDSNS